MQDPSSGTCNISLAKKRWTYAGITRLQPTDQWRRMRTSHMYRVRMHGEIPVVLIGESGRRGEVRPYEAFWIDPTGSAG